MEESLKEKYPFLSEKRILLKKNEIIPGYNKESILKIIDSMIELNYAEYLRLNLPEESSQFIKVVNSKTFNNETLSKYSYLCSQSKACLESVEKSLVSLQDLVKDYQDIIPIDDTESLYLLSNTEISSRLDKIYKLRELLSFYVSLFKSAKLLSEFYKKSL